MGTRITEVKTVKVNHGCVDNPVYLNWLGTNGGRNFWLFGVVQTEILDVGVTGEFFPAQNDIENAIGNGEYLGKEAQPELIVGAYVDLEDVRGLKGLMMSPDVLMLTNPTTWQNVTQVAGVDVMEGAKWQRVKVAPQTFKVLETNQTKVNVELTLLLPTINIQQQ